MDGFRAGAWYKDALPPTNADKKKVWYTVTQYHTPIQTGNYFYEYNNYSDFITVEHQKVHPEVFFTGTGSVVYNGSFYFHDYDSYLKRYDLKTKAVISRARLPYATDYSYSRGSRTYIDLNVDEKGMWAVYTTRKNHGYLTISKLDPVTLRVERTWTTNRRKTTVSNVFFVCGTMYTMDTFDSRSPRKRQYAFDTSLEREFYPKIYVPSKYGGTYQLSYNPREKMIFAWDNGHLLTYPVRFQ